MASTTLVFSQSQTGDIPYKEGPCPQSQSAGTAPYRYVELKNTTTQLAVVSVWTAKAPGGPELDTRMQAYSGAIPPASYSDWLNCVGYSDRVCNTSPCEAAPAQWSGLVSSEGHGVQVPAGNSMVVYVSTFDTASTGFFALNVQTDLLQ
jgi:hypothetical protein